MDHSHLSLVTSAEFQHGGLTNTFGTIIQIKDINRGFLLKGCSEKKKRGNTVDPLLNASRK